jgi:hypothetical protein
MICRLIEANPLRSDEHALGICAHELPGENIPPPNEARHKLCRWSVIDFLGRPDLLQMGDAHDCDAIRDSEGFFLIVGDVESRDRKSSLDSFDLEAHDGLLVDLARQLGVHAVVRGLRASTDFEYEFQLALTNRDLDPEFESVYLMTSRDFSFISSSIVRQVKSYGGDVSRFVPKCVERALTKKLSKSAP